MSKYGTLEITKDNKMKHVIHNFYRLPLVSLALVVATISVGFVPSTPAAADNETKVTCKDGSQVTYQVGGDAAAACKDHGGLPDAATPPASTAPAEDPSLTCNILPQAICDSAKSDGSDTKKSGIFALLKWVLNILTAVVGIAAVGTLVYAGIMYSSAGDDNGMVSKAKTIIRDTVIGIVAYGLMVILLNWIVPGGVFG